MKFNIQDVFERYKDIVPSQDIIQDWFIFTNRLQELTDLIDAVIGSNPRKPVIDLALNSSIVSLTTFLEVFLKSSIINNTGKWSISGVDALLKDQVIQVKDVFDYLKSSTIEKEHLIVHLNNFQNLGSINRTFSFLTNNVPRDGKFDFLNYLGKYELASVYRIVRRSRFPDNCLNVSDPDWKSKIGMLLEWRHKIVHEAKIIELGYDQLVSLMKLLTEILWAMCEVFQVTINGYDPMVSLQEG